MSIRVNYTFRHRNWSNYLVDYTNNKALKLKKYETHKPFSINVTFMDEKHERIVNLMVECDGVSFASKVTTDDFFEAIDMSFEKVIKQLEKHKTKAKSSKMRRSKNQKVEEHIQKLQRRKAA